MRTTLAVLVDQPLQLVDGKAPTELRLFRAGVNPSVKGEYLFDAQAAEQVMKAYREMARPWVIADYDHGSLQSNPVDPSKSSKAAGRAALELRGGELWATNIRWTPEARAAIEREEWPSVSPAFEFDADGRPTWLMNFALTGNPALHGPVELSLNGSAARARVAALSVTFSASRRSKALSAATEYKARDGHAWAAAPSSHPALTAPLSGRYDDPADVGGWLGWAEPEDESWILFVDVAGHGLLWTEREEDGGVVGDPLRVERPDLVTQAQIPLVAQPQIPSLVAQTSATNRAATEAAIPRENRMKTAAELAQFMGCTEAEAQAMLDALAQVKMGVKPGEEMMAAVTLSIGLDTKAKRGDVVTRLAGLQAFERSVLVATGAKDATEALGAVAGLAATQARVATQDQEIAALKSAGVKRDVEALLSTARAEKRITPAEHDDNGEHGLRMTALSFGERGAAWLKANLANRPVIAALSTEYREPGAGQNSGDAQAQTPVLVAALAAAGLPADVRWETLSNPKKHDLRMSDRVEHRDAYKALVDEYVSRNPHTRKDFTHLNARPAAL